MAEDTNLIEQDDKVELTQEELTELAKNSPLGVDSGILSEINEMFSGNRIEDIQNIEDLASDNEDVAGDEGVKTLLQMKKDALNKKQTEAASSKADDNKEEDEEEEEEENLEEDKDGNIKTNKDPFSSSKETPVKSIAPEKLTAEIGKVLNIEVKDAESAGKVLKAINKFRKDSQNLEAVNTEFTNYKAFFSTLPKPLIAAILAVSENKPWESAIGQAAAVEVDYTQDFDAIEDDKKLALLNNYFGADTFKDIKSVSPVSLNAVKNIFNKEKQLHLVSIEAEKQKSASLATEFDNALKSSVEDFKTKFPDFDSKFVAVMSKKIKSGQFMEYFIKDGKPVKDAVARLTLAVAAEEKIKSLEAELASLKGSKKVVDKTSNLSTSRPDKRVKGTNKVDLPDAIQKQLKELSSLQEASKQTY